PASGFGLTLEQDAGGLAPVRDTLTYADTLRFGGMDSLFFPLADSMVTEKRLRVSLISSKAGELSTVAIAQDTVFRIRTAKLASPSDTLRLDSSAAFLTLPSKAAQAKRVFVEAVTITSLPGHLSPASGDLPLPAYRIAAPDFDKGNLILATASSDSAGSDPSPAHNEPLNHWHFSASADGPWLKLDTLGYTDPPRAEAFGTGMYALLANRDAKGPLIQLSSRGQVILPDDYVPLRTPIDIVIRDGEGVDMAMHPPSLKSLRQAPDSSNLVQESPGGFPTLARLQFTPDHGTERDSLTVT